jgi:hypothetical protein
LLSTRYVKTPPSSTSGCKSTAVLQTPSDWVSYQKRTILIEYGCFSYACR